MLPRQAYVVSTLQSCAAVCQQILEIVLPSAYEELFGRANRLSEDCRDLCDLTAKFVERESEHLPYLLRECAELCRTCADTHARLAPELALFKASEQACRRAEDACRTAYH